MSLSVNEALDSFWETVNPIKVPITILIKSAEPAMTIIIATKLRAFSLFII